MRLLFRPTPRTFAIASDSYALTLQADDQTGRAGRAGVRVRLVALGRQTGSVDLLDEDGEPTAAEAVPADQLDGFRPFYPAGLVEVETHGTLGLIETAGHLFVAVVHASRPAATIRPGESVERVLSVEFYSLTGPDFDSVCSASPVATPSAGGPIMGIGSIVGGFQQLQAISGAGPSSGPDLGVGLDGQAHPCGPVKKLLSDGSFYFSHSFDITARLQDRATRPSHPFDRLKDGWVWNDFLASPLVEFRRSLSPASRAIVDQEGLVTALIRGFASTRSLGRPGRPDNDSISIISRLSCLHAGTRFNARGINDDGNVANFVESETILDRPDGPTFAYVQIRGSVPVFWEQTAGLIPGQQKIKVTLSEDATEAAFRRHAAGLLNRYGGVHVVNLLSWTRPGEARLMDQFQAQIERFNRTSQAGPVRETQYDFNVLTRTTGYEAAKEVCDRVAGSADEFGFCVVEDGAVIVRQSGVFRTNCLDCLDRTNLVQTLLGQMALEAFFRQPGLPRPADPGKAGWETVPSWAEPGFWDQHNCLWADNGDSLSHIYAGTGALKSSFTRTGRMGIAGALSDASKSVSRMYINNFADAGRQNVIDRLLGRELDIEAVRLVGMATTQPTKAVRSQPSRRTTIWAGTFNLNGRTDGLAADLEPWLFPTGTKVRADIVAVSMQELVELTAQQIVASDSSVRLRWEHKLLAELNGAGPGGDYVLLRGSQLVGTSLSIFVRRPMLGLIRNVEAANRKTGLSGMAGNKGAVAIRFEVGSASICLVSAHLAAGQDNVSDRNRDVEIISAGLAFGRGRTMDSHDAVVWLGDFNYRLTLKPDDGFGIDQAIEAAEAKSLGMLLQRDQLAVQMKARAVFDSFVEAPVLFAPTYRLEVGSDPPGRFDRRRIPSWCDRVLWRAGPKMRSIRYDSAPVWCSDHTPVYALLDWQPGRLEREPRRRPVPPVPVPPPVPPARSQSGPKLTDLLTEDDLTAEPAKSVLDVARLDNSNGLGGPRTLSSQSLIALVPARPPRRGESARPCPPPVPPSRKATPVNLIRRVPERTQSGPAPGSQLAAAPAFAGLDSLVFGGRAGSPSELARPVTGPPAESRGKAVVATTGRPEVPAKPASLRGAPATKPSSTLIDFAD